MKASQAVAKLETAYADLYIQHQKLIDFLLSPERQAYLREYDTESRLNRLFEYVHDNFTLTRFPVPGEGEG